jgi:chaperonin GroES
MHQMFRVTPLEDKIIVKRTVASDRPFGTVYLPESAQKPCYEGEIIVTGPGLTNEHGVLVPMNPALVPGVWVMFGKYCATEIQVDDVDYLMMSASDVLGIVEKPPVDVGVAVDQVFGLPQVLPLVHT